MGRSRIRSGSYGRWLRSAYRKSLVVQIAVWIAVALSSIQIVQEHRSIRLISAKRAEAALDMLAAVHSQAMVHRRSTRDEDAAVATFNGTISDFSRNSQNVRLWVAMGPGVVTLQRSRGQRVIELPKDSVDLQVLDSGVAHTVTGNRYLRLSRPVILGQAQASDARCMASHGQIMGMKPGEIIGVYSAQVDMRPELLAWKDNALSQMVIGLGIAAASGILIIVLLHGRVLLPVRRLNQATREISNGRLDTVITDVTRRDELGNLARALARFQETLKDKDTLQAKNEHMARHDSLTGLINRAGFNERLASAINQAREEGSRVAVIAIDLDRFKEINDNCGHAMGDRFLVRVAGNLMACCRRNEALARWGGDEFCLFKRFELQAQLDDFIESLEAGLNCKFRIDELEMNSSGSIGVAVWPNDAADVGQLINNADLAMYRAKRSFTNKVCRYQPEMDEIARERRALAADLKAAFEAGKLEVHYQVQRAIDSDEVIGYEALARWPQPDGGFIPPTVFVPIAEECGLILELGAWVLRKACEDAAEWENRARVSVNLSTVQFMHGDIVRLVQEALINSGLSPHRLEIEITESVIIGDQVRAFHILRQIKALGVTVAIDDFGTGYSSLSMLHAFPFDKIKIDASFLEQIEDRSDARSIVRAILSRGRSINVPVLAEGIETPGQMEFLRSEGCEQGQGFLLGLPAPVQDAALPDDLPQAGAA